MSYPHRVDSLELGSCSKKKLQRRKETTLRRFCLLCLLIGMPVIIYSQTGPSSDPNPLSSEAQQAWTRSMANVVAAAEKMPEEKYAYKPTPESISFRDLVAHAADSAMFACSALNGERKNGGAAEMQTKSELVGALRADQGECQKPYPLTDSKAAEMITGGRRGPRSRLSSLWGNTAHIEHEYAQMAVY
jgi:hypothetical protein